jgi:hypothetical protein
MPGCRERKENGGFWIAVQIVLRLRVLDLRHAVMFSANLGRYYPVPQLIS